MFYAAISVFPFCKLRRIYNQNFWVLNYISMIERIKYLIITTSVIFVLYVINFLPKARSDLPIYVGMFDFWHSILVPNRALQCFLIT